MGQRKASAGAMEWALALVLSTGCSVRVYSPPGGAPPLETSAPLGQGETRVAADVTANAETFGPVVMAYRATVARGLTDRLDLSLSPSAMVVGEGRSEDSHPGIYALRTGVKYAPSPYFAVTSGLALGGSAGGGFVAPDAGFVAAFENPYLIPFVSGRGLVSVPVARRTVHITVDDGADADRADDPDAEPDTYSLRPDLTVGFQASSGLKLPLLHRAEAPAHPALTCGGGLTALFDVVGQRQSSGYMMLGCAVDVVF